MIELTFRLIEESGFGMLPQDILAAQKAIGGGWQIRDISHAIGLDADGCVIQREALVTFWREYHHLNVPDEIAGRA
jgi:hypothetical protein